MREEGLSYNTMPTKKYKRNGEHRENHHLAKKSHSNYCFGQKSLVEANISGWKYKRLSN